MFVKEIHAEASPPLDFTAVEGMFSGLIGSLLSLAGIALFVMILIGGFKYITSGGNPEAAAGARNTITYSVIGLIVVAGAYLVLVVIEEITGAPVTNFSF
jgi:hypothetical protein